MIVNNFLRRGCSGVVFFLCSIANLTALNVGYFYALEADLEPILAVSEKRIQARVPGATITEFRIGDHEGFAIQMGSGNVQTAMSTTQLLAKYSIDLAISVGPTGNLRDLKVGEIVRVVSGIAFQKTGEQKLEILDPPMGLGAVEALPGVRLASGEQFINTEADRSALADETGAEAVDMNLFGLAHVLAKRRIPSLHLRIVSDHADEAAGETFLEFVEIYEGELGKQVVEFLQTLEPDPTAPGSYEALRELGEGED